MSAFQCSHGWRAEESSRRRAQSVVQRPCSCVDGGVCLRTCSTSCRAATLEMCHSHRRLFPALT